MHSTIEKMLKKPGFYMIGSKLSGGLTRVEVDETLTCHQLNWNKERDGVLAPDGWSPYAYVAWELPADKKSW